jgi:hypothetical protein
MGKPAPPPPAMLFVGVLFSDGAFLLKAKNALSDLSGEIMLETPEIKWDYSDYYKNEMGRPIYRKFLFFKDLIQPERLVGVKLETNRIEEAISEEGKRRVNLDPGYLTPAKVVLASTKDYSHRIYMGRGIYAEVTLTYSNGMFIPHINTYPDYRDGAYFDIFKEARNMLKALLIGGKNIDKRLQ